MLSKNEKSKKILQLKSLCEFLKDNLALDPKIIEIILKGVSKEIRAVHKMNLTHNLDLGRAVPTTIDLQTINNLDVPDQMLAVKRLGKLKISGY